MSDINPQFAQEIARLVMQRLAQVPPQADVRPPVGICTGDYSKFPELAQRQAGAKPQAAPETPDPSTTRATPASEPAPLTGIITAGQLQQAVAAASDGVARVAPDARLSPLAADFAREHPDKIKRLNPSGGGASSGKPAANASGGAGQAADTWTWWIEGHCPAVQSLVNRPGTNLRPSPESHVSSAMARVVRDLAEAIKSKRTLGGVLFVPSAAKVMCLTNRCASIRAVLGTCGQAVEQGVADLGANVLVIEYPHLGPAKMAQMLERFTAQPPTTTPMLERQLADLHRCG